MQNTDAILMASGYSKRFGEENKLLWPVKGKPLAQHTLELACGLGLGRVFFVTAAPGVAALARDYDAIQLHNAHPGRGMRESIRLGVSASTAEHYLFFTCDQPFLDEGTVRAVLARAGKGLIVYPAHKGVPGHPALFSADFREELLGLGPGGHARDIRARHPGACVEVPVGERVLRDIDYLEEVAKEDRPEGE